MSRLTITGVPTPPSSVLLATDCVIRLDGEDITNSILDLRLNVVPGQPVTATLKMPVSGVSLIRADVEEEPISYNEVQDVAIRKPGVIERLLLWLLERVQ